MSIVPNIVIYGDYCACLMLLHLFQLSSWMKTASESFLVRFDLGTSLVTTEDLEMEFQEFKARAQVTVT